MRLTFREYHLFALLKQFENQYLPLDTFLNQYFRAHKALGSKDRAMILESVYGMTRWQLLLDHLANGKPSWEKRWSIFHAFQPNNYLFANHLPLNVRLSCPKVLFDRLLAAYGEKKTIEICQTLNTQAPLCVRANPLKTERDKLFEMWSDQYEVSKTEHSPLGIQFKKRVPLRGLPEFRSGFFEVQDEASQLVSALVKAQPKQQILDYCAGAGGKTLGFAPNMQNQGQVYLHDIRPAVLIQAKKRMQRAGIQNVQFLDPLHAQLVKIKKRMDWVLADVPCTGTGTLRRNPDQKWKFHDQLLERLISQQRTIFEKALSFLKPEGKIVYATCSILHEENQAQVDHFLQTYPVKLEEPPFQSLPTPNGMDGFFAATFSKTH